jgi:hypothetical protein
LYNPVLPLSFSFCHSSNIGGPGGRTHHGIACAGPFAAMMVGDGIAFIGTWGKEEAWS